MIASGGFGEIHEGPGETVYKKSRSDNWGLGDEAIIREAAALQVLADDPQVIDLLGFGVCEARPYLVLPRIRDMVLDEAEVDYPVCLAIWAGTAFTIMRGHKRGIVHRDIKPENIFLTPKGPLAFDYGLCHIQGQEDLAVEEDYFLGSPHSVPPEVILDPNYTPGPEQDFYQLGVLLHFLSEGDFPTQGESADEVLENVVKRVRYKIRPELRAARDLLMDDRDIEKAMALVAALMSALMSGEENKRRER